jgi:hypothetical protein
MYKTIKKLVANKRPKRNLTKFEDGREFYAFWENLSENLNESKIPKEKQNELISLVSWMSEIEAAKRDTHEVEDTNEPVFGERLMFNAHTDETSQDRYVIDIVQRSPHVEGHRKWKAGREHVNRLTRSLATHRGVSEKYIHSIVGEIISRVIYSPHTEVKLGYDTAGIYRVRQPIDKDDGGSVGNSTGILTNGGYVNIEQLRKAKQSQESSRSIKVACYNPVLKDIEYVELSKIDIKEDTHNVPIACANNVEFSDKQLIHVDTKQGPLNLTVSEIMHIEKFDPPCFTNPANEALTKTLNNTNRNTRNEGLGTFSTALLVSMIEEAGVPNNGGRFRVSDYPKLTDKIKRLIKQGYLNHVRVSRNREEIILDEEKLQKSLKDKNNALNPDELLDLYAFSCDIYEILIEKKDFFSITYNELERNVKEIAQQNILTTSESKVISTWHMAISKYPARRGKIFLQSQKMFHIKTPTGYVVAKRNQSPVILCGKSINHDTQYIHTIGDREFQANNYIADAVNELALYHIKILPTIYKHEDKNFIKRLEYEIVRQAHHICSCLGAPLYDFKITPPTRETEDDKRQQKTQGMAPGTLLPPTKKKAEVKAMSDDDKNVIDKIKNGDFATDLDEKHQLRVFSDIEGEVFARLTKKHIQENAEIRKTLHFVCLFIIVLAFSCTGYYFRNLYNGNFATQLVALSFLCIISFPISYLVIADAFEVYSDDVEEIAKVAIDTSTANILIKSIESRYTEDKDLLRKRSGIIVDALTNNELTSDDKTRFMGELAQRINSEMESENKEREEKSKAILSSYLESDSIVYGTGKE